MCLFPGPITNLIIIGTTAGPYQQISIVAHTNALSFLYENVIGALDSYAAHCLGNHVLGLKIRIKLFYSRREFSVICRELKNIYSPLSGLGWSRPSL